MHVPRDTCTEEQPTANSGYFADPPSIATAFSKTKPLSKDSPEPKDPLSRATGEGWPGGPG